MKEENWNMAEENIANQPTVAQEPRAESELAGVSIQSRLLPFWREIPRAWFIQFEAVVDPLKTSDDQKFRYVLQQLQATDLQHLTDILYKPPATNKYDAIKKRLLAVYADSEVKNFQKLVSGLELGDQKPTQLLRKMRELSGGMITDEGIRIEWLNQLPSQVRLILLVNTESSLDTLAAMADKMVEYYEPASTSIAAVSTSSSQGKTNPQSEILDRLEKLTLQVAALQTRSRQRYRHPFRSRSRSRSKSFQRNRNSANPGDDNWQCKYHFRFGDKAKRCESPCCRRRANKPTLSEN